MIWGMFFAGQLMHLLMQVDAIARAKNTPITSRMKILEDRAIPITVRLFLCTLIFGLTLGGGMPDLYMLFGAEAPQWVVRLGGLLANTSIVGWSIAGMVGFGVDSAIGFLPFVKTYIPPPIDQQQAVEQKGFEKGVEATKVEVKAAVEDIHPTSPIVPEIQKP